MHFVARTLNRRDDDIEIVQTPAEHAKLAADVCAVGKNILVLERERASIANLMFAMGFIKGNVTSAIIVAATGERRRRQRVEARPYGGLTGVDRNSIKVVAVFFFDDDADVFDVLNQIARASRAIVHRLHDIAAQIGGPR